ncbi:MAG: helix-turn-helix domain-containing protein [Chitinophagales bacterium]|jgi:hypothetical protein
MQKLALFTDIEIDNLINRSMNYALEHLKQENPVETPEDEFITRQNAADILKVSLVTMSDWDKKGILTPYRYNTRIRYKKSEIQNLSQTSKI